MSAFLFARLISFASLRYLGVAIPFAKPHVLHLLVDLLVVLSIANAFSVHTIAEPHKITREASHEKGGNDDQENEGDVSRPRSVTDHLSSVSAAFSRCSTVMP